MGALAWFLKHESGDPRLATQLIIGAAGAVLGGVAMNLFLSEGVMALNAWGFASAAVVALIVLALLQARVGGSGDGAS